MDKVQDDEIDLFSLLETIWDGKWKIIATTFVAAVIGVVFSIVKPNSFEVSTPIQIAKPSVFLPYTTLNSLLKQKGLYFEKEFNEFGYKIDRESVFNAVVVEFNDYEEMVDVLSEDEFVKQSVKGLDDRQKQKALIGFAKKFKIVPPSNEEKEWYLKFEWHNDYEGRSLFSVALQKTLINIQKTLKNNIDELAKAIERKNSYQLEKLQNDLNAIKQNEKEKLKKRIKFLNEQYSIAMELEIETNKLNISALSQNSQNQISLSINLNDVFYYLRGYKAIKKEIELIENRSEENVLLMADGYVSVHKGMALLQNDKSSSQLKNAAKLIESENPKDWVVFDFKLAEAKSQKKWMLYIALSIVLGGMVGVIYVLISNAYKIRQNIESKS
ncbi:Wzz/FepE/Etk N-terminal domain-containing protein [Alphaproteobacteria bacterium]|nr:Wzz/FepE/Etk N-terminal domain-containing protein [Alphaproteobacteria bacterium]